ncbi:hypothetical protein MMC28_009462 [Mycoblastus sanguinarius]|nr:hypothetical protein [Mycoblastus sanguinarius]
MFHIIKAAIYLGAAIALLRSAAAVIPYHNHNNQLALQPPADAATAAKLATSTEHLQVAAAQTSGSGQAAPSVYDSAPPAPIENAASHNDAVGQSPSSHKPKFSVSSTGSQWAITYSPYNDDNTCKSKSAVQKDVATIARKGFASIRLYATDCSALQNVGTAAIALQLKLILGVHIDDSDLSAAQPQVNEITTWAAGKWDAVEMVVIGNEVIFNEYCTASALASLISHARSSLRDAGYTGPITTTEPLNILSENAVTLCPVLDIAAANIHPFFHAEVSAEAAGDYVVKSLLLLDNVCPGLEAVNLETGWPSKGLENGLAVPGKMQQIIAIANIMQSAGGRSVFLGFGDDGWKDEGEFGVEQSWGCSHIFEDV